MSDYRIGEAGTTVTILSERAARRGVPLHWPKADAKLVVGSMFKFPIPYEVTLFMRLREAEGYVFEGKEELVGV